LENALFVKLNCNEKEEADVFRTFIQHNYRNSTFETLGEDCGLGVIDGQIWLDRLNFVD
jgi:hypothetical protein